MSKTSESPASSKGLAAGARAVILVAVRALRALYAEHALALLSATKAALPRRRLTDLRETYTADQDRGADPDSLMLPEAAKGGQPSAVRQRGAAVRLRGPRSSWGSFLLSK